MLKFLYKFFPRLDQENIIIFYFIKQILNKAILSEFNIKLNNSCTFSLTSPLCFYSVKKPQYFYILIINKEMIFWKQVSILHRSIFEAEVGTFKKIKV